MASPEPSLTAANFIGGETEHTWAYLRSPVWPGTGLNIPNNNFLADHNVGYPQSYDVDGNHLPLLKSFQFKQGIGISYAWNLPVGVNMAEDPGWTPPDPNPDNLIAKVTTRLCIGFGIGQYLGVYQGTQYTSAFDPPGFQNVLGYDYNTTKAALVGAQVNVTCRFWPIPYVDEFTWDEITATVPIAESMFPENQNSQALSNIYGGVDVFVGTGQYLQYGTPTQFPPEPFTVNWIQMPT